MSTIVHYADRLAVNIKIVQSSAKDYGGMCTYPFSQSLPPVDSLLNRHSGTDGGICEALSTKWIVEHSKDGSLWTWLFPGGKLSTSALYNVMINFVDDEIQGISQMRKVESYLGMHGIIKRKNIVSGDFMETMKATAQGHRGSRGHLGRRMVSAIQRVQRNTSGNYLYMRLRGNGGHAICGWMGQDAAFFDPNFGEFWFERSSQFLRWLPVFTRIADYEDDFHQAYAYAYAKKM